MGYKRKRAQLTLYVKSIN